MTYQLSKRSGNLRRSPVRDILSFHGRSDMISFAGGLPSSMALPVSQMKECADLVLTKYGSTALQYGTTEGFPLLREWIAAMLTRKGIPTVADEILLTSGSQQALDLIGRLFLDPGDPVYVSFPCYNGALQSFEMNEATILPFSVADACNFVEFSGNTNRLHDSLIALNQSKFTYLVPTLNNPSGHTLSLRERMLLAEFFDRTNSLLFEDDPYCDLLFSGESLGPVASFIRRSSILTGSFSKIISPSLRTGWLRAPKEMMAKLIPLKQAMDLHSNLFSQMMIYMYLTSFSHDRLLSQIRNEYKEKQLFMKKSLELSGIGLYPVKETSGGMFLWVRFYDFVDTDQFIKQCLANGVAFVPGSAFYVNKEEGKHYARFNYTVSDFAQIAKGVDRLKESYFQMLIPQPSI